MAPTTLEGMQTTTCPYGRDVSSVGSPLKITEILATLPGTYYVTRQAVHTAKHVRMTKKAIRKGFEYSRLKKGTSFIEVVSSCNEGWKMTPVDANKWMEKNMFPTYPIGDIKVPKN
jgi:2-oxoglutarate ferredoxin oxidoreductase subunit beta